MIKVYEDFDFSRVGQMQSLLESEGIATFLKNQFGSSVMGEIPFVEVIPQLFILEEKDLARAKRLMSLNQPSDSKGVAWTCPRCSVEVEANFDQCWNCETSRPND